jgi:caffeoyl-CoA O-methyltransferase
MADNDSRQGIRYVNPELLAHVVAHHSPHDAALERAFRAPDAHALPAIQISPSEGKVLTLLMRMLGARRVVEVGTLAGYSALCLARGLPPEGRLLSFEADPRHAAVARDNIAFAGEATRVEVRALPALEGLADLGGHPPFDAMFIDADKAGYPDYARWANQHLRPGGLLIADNAYYFGSLLAETEEAARMREFHAYVAANFDSACLPTPDGMVLALRR